jgi:hypothetical protein
MRGNYPEARDLFRRGLTEATRAGSDEHRRAAHHGLLVAAVAARDVETALAHGWAAFSETSADASDERAEMLLNLGEVGRQAGEYRASLGACLTALELTDSARLRLPALGCAAIAAAQLGERRLLEFLAREVERTARRSGQPFEVARALMDLADACAVVDDAPKALAFAAHAESLAAANGFHEVTARADAVRTASSRFGVPSSIRQRRSWTPRAQTIFASLETLPAVGDPHTAEGLVPR